MKKTLAVTALAALMAVAAQATTIEPTGYNGTAGMMVNLRINTTTEQSVWAGPMTALLDGTTTLDVYCLDFFTSIGYQPYSVVLSPAASGFFDNAARMYSTFVGNVRTATPEARTLYGAALQVALWEVTIDGYNPAQAGMDWLTSGNFQKSAVQPLAADGALEGIVKTYLGAQLGPIAPGVTIFESDSKYVPMQTLIGDNVPEPGTWALIGAGLLMAGIARRRF